MQTSHYASQHSDLPEHVPESDVAEYKFSVPDRTPPFTTVQAVPPSSPYSEDSKPVSRRSLTRWPFLILYGTLLAVIAGVAGGFIGKTIERSNHQNDNPPENESCPTLASVSPASPSTTSSISSATPTPSSAIFERTLAQPSTGCTSSTSYNSFKARTQFLEWQYTTVCGHGWLNDELIALSTATVSDCVEACVMYNAYKSDVDRTCVGGGFIPEWWNQTRAMDESGGMAYNCFLKSNASGIARNDKKYEVVALCLDGWCDDISG